MSPDFMDADRCRRTKEIALISNPVSFGIGLATNTTKTMNTVGRPRAVIRMERRESNQLRFSWKM